MTYLETKLERTKIRKQRRKDKRKEKKRLYGPYKKRCDQCGSWMTWCTICEVHSSDCCTEWGSCLCS